KIEEGGAEERELSFQHRDVDALPLAGLVLHPQREQRPVGGIHACREIGDGDAGARAVRARLARDADHAALGLQDEVERRAVAVRAVLAEPRDGAVDDALVPLARRLVVEPEPLESVDPEVLQHDVALLDELEEELLAFRLLEIDDDAALVAMQADEI